MAGELDPRAPMASAPMKYREDGAVDWGNMWDSFCVLALDGGPPHRGTMLDPQTSSDPASASYRAATAEIARGIGEVSGLVAAAADTGWIAVQCASAAHARWLATAIVRENVRARADRGLLYLPTGESFTLNARVVVNAAGPWAPFLLGKHRPAVKLVKGTHIVLPAIAGCNEAFLLTAADGPGYQATTPESGAVAVPRSPQRSPDPTKG